ncbi:MAG TPA: hypothetical protein VL171_04190 [Verrucomicrobiae bacterium]|nr:hypothetical protein [Verrucomicrobiae bacterium]
MARTWELTNVRGQQIREVEFTALPIRKPSGFFFQPLDQQTNEVVLTILAADRPGEFVSCDDIHTNGETPFA